MVYKSCEWDSEKWHWYFMIRNKLDLMFELCISRILIVHNAKRPPMVAYEYYCIISHFPWFPWTLATKTQAAYRHMLTSVALCTKDSQLLFSNRCECIENRENDSVRDRPFNIRHLYCWQEVWIENNNYFVIVEVKMVICHRLNFSELPRKIIKWVDRKIFILIKYHEMITEIAKTKR